MTWLTDRQTHGGIDPVVIPGIGTLWLCGKHLIAPDPELALRQVGAASVWCLTEAHELDDRYPGYVEWLRADPRARWHPIHDLGAPSDDVMRRVVSGILADVGALGSSIVHCGAGIGRAGTTPVCVLIESGVSPAESVAAVAAARPGAGPESGPQSELVDRWMPSRR